MSQLDFIEFGVSVAMICYALSFLINIVSVFDIVEDYLGPIDSAPTIGKVFGGVIVGTPLITLAHFVFGVAGSILAAIAALAPLIMLETYVATPVAGLAHNNDNLKSYIVMMVAAPIASIAWAIWIVLSLEQPVIYNLYSDDPGTMATALVACVCIAFFVGTVAGILTELAGDLPYCSCIAHAIFIGIGLCYGAASIFVVIQHVEMGNATISDFALIALPLFSLALYTIRAVIHYQLLQRI